MLLAMAILASFLFFFALFKDWVMVAGFAIGIAFVLFLVIATAPPV